jgi:chloride channel protein, CIC family
MTTSEGSGPTADRDDLGVSPHYTQVRSFWRLMGYAVLLGVLGALAGLVFLGITGLGADWYGEAGVGWFDGKWWWVLVSAGAGLLVGVLRSAFGMPEKPAGIIENLKASEVEPTSVPALVAVSAVSLIGGASLGPEVALGSMGGGAGTWLGRRVEFDDDEKKAATLSGIGGAFGGLFSSPLLSVALVLEVAQPSRKVRGMAFFATVVSASISFGVYFAIAGSVFLGLYDVPAFDFEDWHLLAGVGLGLLAAVVVVLAVGVGNVVKKLLGRLPTTGIVRPVIGGLTFGLVGVALPLTLFTGSDQLGTILDNVGSLGIWLLVATLLAKMFVFSVSSESRFIGGPIFPILFIGGLAGVIVNAFVPEVPLGLAFSCMLAAVPGAIVAAPFSMVLLVALLTQIGTLQTAPVLIAVATSYLAVAGIRYVIAQRSAPVPGPSVL